MSVQILVVDDEPFMLKLLERIITGQTPYQVTTTNNSLEVPQLLEQRQFDLIIVDLKMPGMDGIDILRYVKTRERDEEVIMITAFASQETARKALELGVFEYITKPFKKDQIIYTLDKAIRWLHMKRQVLRLEQIMNLEPYTSAQQSFEQLYIRYLAEKCDRDVDQIVARSGLSQESIAAALKEENNGELA
ncbi:response regulator [candidate division CSSED10-310 bacterium]|uniref:Response regulator n=1 Tax=candidate division CSSED10-310 bacterium TaxID=2855610 RepID=A0ABV6YSD1_UNCC1